MSAALLRLLAALLLLASFCRAEPLPGFYHRVSRVLWVVQHLDQALAAWEQLGMESVHAYGTVTLREQYRGRDLLVPVRLATAHLGSLTVDMLEPSSTPDAFSAFLAQQGEGIMAIVHEVESSAVTAREIARLHTAGVEVLTSFTMPRDGASVSFTLLATGEKGKYVLGLLHWPGGAPANTSSVAISHIGPVIRDAAPVSAFWTRFGFPPLTLSHASPRYDSRYRAQPLLLDFDVAWQRHTQFTLEWIVPPSAPPNIYADFLKLHGEGIQHLGMPVDDLPASIERCRRLGYPVWQSGAWGEVGRPNSGQYAYLDTDRVGGVSLELIHAYK